jgi:hypothetical protein
MKRILIILACWAGALSIFAQDNQTSTTSTSSKEFHTLFSNGDGTCKIPMGYFFEFNGGYTHFGKRSEFLPGISMGMILNHHWTIGVTGNFLPSSQGNMYHHKGNDTVNDDRHHSSLSGGYGGLLLEYTLLPASKFHLSFPLTIGGGYVSHTHYGDVNDSTDTKKWFHHSTHYFVVEPGIKLAVNVIKHLQIGLTLSYRYSPENNHMITSPDMLNQLTGKLSFRFGKF